jgi:hypothetical protein
VHDLNGRDVSVDVARSGKLTVVYWFSPTCVWCKRNSANMRAMMEGAGKRFDFVALSVTAEGVRQYLAENQLRGEAYAEPSVATRSAYGFGGTPQTIVIGADGKIVRSWEGAYSGRLGSEIGEVLGVHLPGLKM